MNEDANKEKPLVQMIQKYFDIFILLGCIFHFTLSHDNNNSYIFLLFYLFVCVNSTLRSLLCLPNKN